MLRAIIFDFNGVILNDEPLHFAAMRDTVGVLGISVSREVYWDKYLPFDDAQCLDAICRDHSFSLSEEERNVLLARKAETYRHLLQGSFPLCDGAVEFIKAAAARYPLALASGARRDEIESALDSADLRRHFKVIVAAEDFIKGKPNPESFLLALEWLNKAMNVHSILPEECLVIEDSVGGVHGARTAGMRCIAVTNNYPGEALRAANRVVSSLEEIELKSLNALFEESV